MNNIKITTNLAQTEAGTSYFVPKQDNELSVNSFEFKQTDDNNSLKSLFIGVQDISNQDNTLQINKNNNGNVTLSLSQEYKDKIANLENKQDNDTVYDDTEIRGILNTKVSLNDLQDDLVIKSQEILDNNLKVVLTYTNTKGQSKDLEINQSLPQYQLPDHLANLTSEQIEKLLKLIENIGVWGG